MRALIVRNGQLAFVADYPRPDPPPGEALIRVARAGICNTDLEILKGYFGFQGVLGHEFVGVVEALNPLPGQAPHIQVGDRVVGEINCVPCDSPARTASAARPIPRPHHAGHRGTRWGLCRLHHPANRQFAPRP
jgi:threonine dehydrogenase-like Zn-dependent dehydrogenase